MVINQQTDQNKNQLAKQLRISRSNLYYQPKLPAKDLKLKAEIEKVMSKHQRYGHKRIAISTSFNLPFRSRI